MKLCVAFDRPTLHGNLLLAQQLKGKPITAKVGLSAFIADGKDLIERLKEYGFEVCLDLKLYDIPNQMAEAARRIAELEVDMFTIHASSGNTGMQAVAEAIDTCFFKPKILAVTVLTSFSDNECYAIYEGDVADKAEYFAVQARKSGMDGIVCSVHECEFLKPFMDNKMILFVPGIRLEETVDDQARKGNLDMAFAVGADYAVIGRPIYMDDEPWVKVDFILETLRGFE